MTVYIGPEFDPLGDPFTWVDVQSVITLFLSVDHENLVQICT